ncbi:MAG: hypothetical protein WCO45_00035 [Pseudanabaena sp. ELA607]
MSPQAPQEIDYWQIFRLYLMPFCVSSFSSLIKDQGFIIVISPKFQEMMTAISSCLIFLLIISSVKLINRKFPDASSAQKLPKDE